MTEFRSFCRAKTSGALHHAEHVPESEWKLYSQFHEVARVHTGLADDDPCGLSPSGFHQFSGTNHCEFCRLQRPIPIKATR